MNLIQKSGINGHVAPILASAGVGLSFVVCAIVLQNGGTRGYASIFLLFVSVGLAILGIIAGIVTLALGRLGTAFEVIASAVILPTTFLLILFVIGSFRGE